jgi:hypothetical protein
MTEPEADCKQRLQRDHDRHTKLRLPMRSLLASGPAHDRQGVARTQGVQLPDQTRSTLVRTGFRTTLNVPRPSHTKNP